MIVPPQPFEEALDALDKRIPRGEPWDTKRWMKEAPEVRQRAFFSAQVENTQFLQRAKDFLTDYLTNATEPVFNDDGSPRIDPQTGQQMTVLKAQGRADFVRQMREFMAAEGMMPAREIDDEDIKKIYSRRRLELIFDTNVRTSYGYGYWEQGNEPHILEAYPAARFVRIPGAKIKRPRHAAYENAVRLKADTAFWIWQNGADIGGFEVPYPPYGFNSYMDQEDVSRSEAIGLKLLDPNQSPPSPESQALNKELKASLDNLDPDLRAILFKELGQTDTGASTIKPAATKKPASGRKPVDKAARFKADMDRINAEASNAITQANTQADDRQRILDLEKASTQWEAETRNAHKRAGLAGLAALRKKLNAATKEYRPARKEIRSLEIQISKIDEERNKLREELTKVPADSDRASVIIAKMTELQKQGFALDDDLQKRSKGIDIPAVQKAVRDLITLPDAVRRKADLSSTFSHAFDYQAGSGSGPARKRVADMEAKGRKHIESLIPASILDDVGAATVAWGYKGRAYASVGSREFQIFSNSPLTHFLHEFVHLVEYNSLRRFAAPGLSPATVRRSHKFYDERTTRPDGTRDPLKKLGPGYEPDEVWREDKWIEKGWNKYAGKQYQGDVWEFNTVGAERFLNDPANFFIDDPEGFFHVLDLLQRRAP